MNGDLATSRQATLARYPDNNLQLPGSPERLADIICHARHPAAVRKNKNPASPRTCGVSPPYTNVLAETEGFEPSIQVLAQMLP
jgi:hypothetical protein